MLGGSAGPAPPGGLLRPRLRCGSWESAARPPSVQANSSSPAPASGLPPSPRSVSGAQRLDALKNANQAGGRPTSPFPPPHWLLSSIPLNVGGVVERGNEVVERERGGEARCALTR